MLKRGDTGAKVVALQEAIIAAGYPLPRWGADGDLGAETLDARALLLRDHGKKFDEDVGAVSDEELAYVLGLARSMSQQGDDGDGPLTGDRRNEFFDRRRDAGQVRVFGRRSWRHVTGITLHQTACNLGERPARWDHVGCHVGVTRGGKVIWLHDFNKMVVHGHGFNRRTVGIECDGTYAGVEGNLRTFWRPKDDRNRQPQSPTAVLIESAQQTIRWICRMVASHGGKVRVLVAHRQSSDQRESDPGSAIWKAVALPLHTELGLSDGGKGFKIESGYPIPEAWNPAYKGIK